MSPTDLGCVVIGRNEGARLRRCLGSLQGRVARIVYVDSDSTDGSVEAARSFGADVVELSNDQPFTAARARNAGWRRLRELGSDIEFVQFVDGDCEVVPGWLETARDHLRAHPDVAVVCGRRRERHPEQSVWNRIVDIEWDTPVGEAKACGGDAMMRLSAVAGVDGYDASLIAGEEPELCLRLRAHGHRVVRLDAEMTLHDIAIARASQWWKRTVRSGHAFAEGAHLHGASPERHWVRETRRIWLWGAVVPALATLGAVPTLGASLGLLLGYPVSAARTYRAVRKRGRPAADSAAYALAITAGKFAELEGVLQFHRARRRGKKNRIIEYK